MLLLLDQFPEPTRLEPPTQSLRQPRQLDQMIAETIEFVEPEIAIAVDIEVGFAAAQPCRGWFIPGLME